MMTKLTNKLKTSPTMTSIKLKPDCRWLSRRVFMGLFIFNGALDARIGRDIVDGRIAWRLPSDGDAHFA
jgi:hypothetical protein